MDISSLTSLVPSLFSAVKALAHRGDTRIRVQKVFHNHSQGGPENNGLPFSQLRVSLRNLGLPLYDTQLVLVFRPEGNFGEVGIPLTPVDSSTDRLAHFANGMIAEFSLKTYRLDRFDLAFIPRLDDARKRGAKLRLRAGGCVVWEYPLGGWGTPLKRRWNQFASWVNRAAVRQVGTSPEGLPIERDFTILPRCKVPADDVEWFCRSVRDLCKNEPVTQSGGRTRTF